MKRVLLGLGIGLMVLLFAGQVFAMGSYTTDVTNSSDSANIAVGTNSIVYTKSFEIDTGEYTALSYYVYSAASGANVGIELEQSYQLPATEGAADTAWEEPINFADIATGFATESDWKHQNLSPAPLKFGRFKLSGHYINGADTIVNIKLHKLVN